MLDREAIKALIPHREPFFLLDSVQDYVVGERISARLVVDPADPVLAGHFPGMPIYPGVLLLEALAQAVVVLLKLDPANAGRTFLFGGANEVRFRRPLAPGEVVSLEAQLTRRTANAAVASVRAVVDGQWVAKAELIAGSAASTGEA